MAPQTGTIDIVDCSRGLSDWYPPRLDPDQLADAWNVDFWDAAVCGRRNGSKSVVTGVAGQVPESIFVHTPTTLRTDDRLWVAGSAGFRFYDQAYAQTIPTVTPADVFTVANGIDWASLHGKLFIAAKSSVNRLHVYDGTTIRRTGMAAPPPPTVATTGSGAFIGTRKYRLRLTTRNAGGTPIRRSEPSTEVTFVPPGNGLAARITFPAGVGEGETHWEVEEIAPSGDWYVLGAFPIGTVSTDDTIIDPTQVPVGRFVSEDIGDYQLQYSARWLTVDEDRLVMGGSHDDDRLSARVAWTPLGGQVGTGNDERIPADVEGFLDFDLLDGGGLTGIKAWEGKVIVFKRGQVHQMVRSSSRLRAYLPDTLSRRHGAVPFSIVEGTDVEGLSCLYFLDPDVGPMQLGFRGLRVLVPQMQRTWKTLLNSNATKICSVTYHAERRQVWWHVATAGSATPNRRWMYSVESDGLVFHTVAAPVMSATAFLGKPHLLVTPGSSPTLALILRGDDPTMLSDDGTLFRAYIRTRAYQMGGLLRRWQIDAGVLEAKAVPATSPDTSIAITLVRDFGIETRTVVVPLAPVTTELILNRPIDNLYLTEGISMQIEIGDAAPIEAVNWQVHGLTFVYSMGSPTTGRG